MYVIGTNNRPDGPVKLGISADPPRRVGQLQTGHADRLQLFHSELVSDDKARLFERLLHKSLNHKRTRGEWFDVTVEQAIADVQHTVIRYDAVDDLANKVQERRI